MLFYLRLVDGNLVAVFTADRVHSRLATEPEQVVNVGKARKDVLRVGTLGDESPDASHPWRGESAIGVERELVAALPLPLTATSDSAAGGEPGRLRALECSPRRAVAPMALVACKDLGK